MNANPLLSIMVPTTQQDDKIEFPVLMRRLKIDNNTDINVVVLFTNMTTGVVVHSDNDNAGFLVGDVSNGWARADKPDVWTKYRGQLVLQNIA